MVKFNADKTIKTSDGQFIEYFKEEMKVEVTKSCPYAINKDSPLVYGLIKSSEILNDSSDDSSDESSNLAFHLRI